MREQFKGMPMGTITTHQSQIGAKARRALLAALLSVALVFGLVPVGQTAQTGIQPSVAYAEESQSTSLQQRLAAIDGVTSVEPITQIPLADGTLPYKEKYVITIEQPIDWSNPGLGTFQQRVVVGYQGDDNINVFETGGYCLIDAMYPQYSGLLGLDDRNEICRTYNANLIEVEYRFFGKSTPAGLSNTSADLWEYLTDENAAQDFHATIGKIGQVLSGKSVFTGASKGGYSTNVQACLYPNDVDAYVAYVAPLCNGTQDTRFIQNVYETIGDNGMTSEQAQECRDLVTQFQVECINNRDALTTYYKNEAAKNGYTFNMGDGVLLDMVVLDFAVEEWQSYQNFDSIRDVLQETDPTAKLNEMEILLTSIAPVYSFAAESPFFPYYIQAWTQMGENYLDFSYLRQALDAAYKEAKAKDPTVDKKKYELSVTPDMDADLVFNVFLTPEQRATLQYSDTTRNQLIAWSQTTTAHSVMIYGGTDPWDAVRIPDVSNPNIHRYVAPAKNHSVRMTDLTAAEQTELSALLDSWLIDYNVTFNMNGVGTAPNTQVVGKGLTAAKPDDPTDSGYTFGGWYTDAECTVAYDFATPVTANITLYARWVPVAPEPEPQPGSDPEVTPTSATEAVTAADVTANTEATTTATTLVNTGDDAALPVAVVVCLMLSTCSVGVASSKRRRIRQ
jgi:uncharacterized repeat protein (TIGR02543 family)